MYKQDKIPTIASSSIGLGIQAFSVWVQFKIVRFIGNRVKPQNFDLVKPLLDKSLKDIYIFLRTMRDYQQMMSQLIQLPMVDIKYEDQEEED